MLSSIANQAERAVGSLLLALALSGCAGAGSAGRCAVDSKPPQAPPPPATECTRGNEVPAQMPGTTNTPTPTSYVQIVLFDCSKAEDVEGGLHMDDSNRISKWMAGGPAGAAWNVSDVVCFADVETTCEEGELASALHVGQRRVAKQKTRITRSGSQHIQLSATERAWRAGMDATKPDPSVPYRTAVFSLLTSITCTKPVEVAPDLGPFHGTADSRAFVAGFAEGE